MDIPKLLEADVAEGERITARRPDDDQAEMNLRLHPHLPPTGRHKT